jgi:hypothetical protein
MDRIIRLAADPTLGRRIVRKLLQRFPLGSFETRLEVGAFERPWYAWCLYYAALEAIALGHTAITALEIGVAGGNGLVQLCKLRDQVEAETSIRIFIHGLDSGNGLPESSDARDLPYCWPARSFKMDYVKLIQRLSGRAEIVLGDVAQTAKQLSIPAEAPLGAIMFDLDYYTSTRDAFALLEHPNLLPRVWCYFDDIDGTPEAVLSDCTGVRAAIRQFNAGRPEMEGHLSQAYVFRHHYPEGWHQQIWVYHRMNHPDYNRFVLDIRHAPELA